MTAETEQATAEVPAPTGLHDSIDKIVFTYTAGDISREGFEAYMEQQLALAQEDGVTKDEFDELVAEIFEKYEN